MSSSISPRVGCSTFIALTLFALLSPSATFAQSGILIAGSVRDLKGGPIEGAELRAKSWDEAEEVQQSARSQADGAYELTGLPDGRKYRVFAKAKGCYSGYVDVPEGRGDAVGINFVLGKEARISGQAVDTSGHAICGGAMALQPTKPQWNRRAGQMVVMPCDTGRVVLDDKGRFEFQNVGEGTYRFNLETSTPVSSYEQVSVGEPLEVKSGDTLSGVSALFNDPQSECIEGIVRDETGAGVPEVDVDAITYEGQHWSAKTDASGHYQLLGLGDHTFDVYFMRKGYPDIKLGKVRPGLRQADVVLAQGGGLAGLVLDATAGTPVKDAEIKLLRLEPEYGFDRGYRSEHQGAKCSQDGRFTISGLLPGTAILGVTAPGYIDKEKRGVVIKAGQVTANLEIRMGPGSGPAGTGDAAKKAVGPAGAIEGTVLSGGKPLEIEQFMDLIALDEPIHTIPAGYIIQEGKYRMDKLAPGRYEICAAARGNGHMAEEKKQVEVKAGETLTVNFELDFPPGKTSR